MPDDRSGDSDDLLGVGDARRKHVIVVARDGGRTEHGEVYLRHTDEAFVVSPESSFPESETTRHPKEQLLRVEIGQHHSACFITTATVREGAALGDLRAFRDDALGRTRLGRLLVWLYDAVSPPVAATLERHPDSRTARIVRRVVRYSAALSRRRRKLDSSSGRLALSLAVTLLYAWGSRSRSPDISVSDSVKRSGDACLSSRSARRTAGGSLAG